MSFVFKWKIHKKDFIKWEALWSGDNSDDPLTQTYPMSPEDPQNPFFKLKEYLGEDLNEREAGDFVAKNDVTLALCKMLSDDDLINKSPGNTHPFYYRATLLLALAALWD